MTRDEFEEAFFEIEKMFHMKPSSDFYKDAFFDEFAHITKEVFLRTAAKIAAHGHRFTIDRLYESIQSQGLGATPTKKKVDCVHCNGTGLVTKTIAGYETGLRCICENAEEYSKHYFPTFVEVQHSKVGDYVIVEDGEWEWRYQENSFVTRCPKDKRGRSPKDNRQFKDPEMVQTIIESLKSFGTYKLD